MHSADDRWNDASVCSGSSQLKCGLHPSTSASLYKRIKQKSRNPMKERSLRSQMEYRFLQEIWETPLSQIQTQCGPSQWLGLWAAPTQLALFFKLEVLSTKTGLLNVTTAPSGALQRDAVWKKKRTQLWSNNYSASLRTPLRLFRPL